VAALLPRATVGGTVAVLDSLQFFPSHEGAHAERKLEGGRPGVRSEAVEQSHPGLFDEVEDLDHYCQAGASNPVNRPHDQAGHISVASVGQPSPIHRAVLRLAGSAILNANVRNGVTLAFGKGGAVVDHPALAEVGLISFVREADQE
jgi:hypothetical protein